MRKNLLTLAIAAAACAITASAASICPSTPTTTSDCDYLITIGATGMASVMDVAGSSAFNSMITFVDGTTDPGGDGSLVGVINDYSKPLASLTLKGSGASAGIFDFSNNGICVYTNAAYCGTAASGYEGPTSTFSNLQSSVVFQTNIGTVNFGPMLAPGGSTFFSIENAASDINANGGLTVTGATFATPEPGPALLFGVGLAVLLVTGVKFRTRLS